MWLGKKLYNGNGDQGSIVSPVSQLVDLEAYRNTLQQKSYLYCMT